MATYIIGAIVFGALGFVLCRVIRRPRGGSGCSGCDGCPCAGQCHRR